MRYKLFLTIYFSLFSALIAADTPKELFSSFPEQIINLASDDDFLIGNVINPLSGQPALRQTDLVAKGAQNIALNRIFIANHTPVKNGSKAHLSDQSYGGWVHFPHTRLSYYVSGKENSKGAKVKEQYACVVDSNGVVLVYSLLNGKCQLKSDPWGISNGFNDHPSACNDPRNTTVSVLKDRIIVDTAEGGKRFYRPRSIEQVHFEKEFYIGSFYLLEKEILPNGKVLKYRYKDRDLVSVYSQDPQEEHIYASLNLDSSPFIFHSQLSTNTNTNAIYHHSTNHLYTSKDAKKPINLLYPLLITSASSPFFQNERMEYRKTDFRWGNRKREYLGLTSYKGEALNFKSTLIEVLEKTMTIMKDFQKDGFKKMSSHYRTGSLLLPGTNDSFESAFTFKYDVYSPGAKAGMTTVSNCDGTKTIFHISPKMLPTSIQHFDQEGQLKKEKLFHWNRNQWLASIEVRDGQRTLSKKHFEYDAFGNPCLERFEGDLCGNGLNESYVTKRLFSTDGRHLLLQEEQEEGKISFFTYLPNTNLMTSKIVQDKETVVSREFREYDEAYNLIKIIHDNGFDDQRKITTYSLRQTNPFLHMPEAVMDTYEENGTAHLLKRTLFHYDEKGNVAREDVYDANNQYRYTINKEYNERGDLLSETNALGFKTIYSYDAHGRLIKTINNSQTKEQSISYDLKGRPKTIKETGLNDGVTKLTTNVYDHHDRLSEKTDKYENKTFYSYDSLSRQPKEIIFPPQYTMKGMQSIIEQSVHDVLGRKIVHIDANKNATRYTYNAYGSPISIIYADQSSETFSYTKSGWLQSHTDQDGLVTEYEYDSLGKVLKKSYFFNNQYLAHETFAYEGENLIRTTDLQNHITTYTYDGAGRKICENQSGKVTTYAYDALGYLTTVREENEPNSLYTHYENDVMGQVLEKTHQSHSGDVLSYIGYTYNPEGNVTSIKKQISNQTAIELLEYDSQQRLTRHIDALGNETKTLYDENAQHPLSGQRALQKKIVSPNNISKLEIYDFFECPVKTECTNADGEIISSEGKVYDACGNVCFHKQDVYEGTNYLDTKTTHYTYDSLHRLTSFTRGWDTPEARTTQFTYTPKGKVAQKTPPSGVVLSYDYDPFGHLIGLTSADGKIKHSFKYSPLGYLIRASDEVQNVSIERKVDAFGNVLVERFSNGLLLKKTYDKFNRPLELTLPDHSQVKYTYDPLFLKQIERFSSSGEQQFIHQYDEYDLNGNLQNETLIDDLGEVSYLFDAKERLVELTSPYLSQVCSYDDVGNLVQIASDNNTNHYTYDSLDQLTSEINSSGIRNYIHDSIFNRVKDNKVVWKYNALDELQATDARQYVYDLNGNLSKKTTENEVSTYLYDHLNQLTEFVSDENKVKLTYDPLGRRLAKTVYTKSEGDWEEVKREHYLYDGMHDIGTYDAKFCTQELQILGLTSQGTPKAVAIELAGKPYGVIHDCQNNIVSLIDTVRKQPATSYTFSAFGETIDADEGIFNPWQYAAKRFDPDLNLINFGKRYYDPSMGRWLTTDPAGFIDGMNLYVYLKNNPFRYVDPDGRCVFLIPLLFGSFALGGEVAIGIVAGEAILGSLLGATLGWGLYEGIKRLDNWADNSKGYQETPAIKKNEKEKKWRATPIDLEEKLTLDESKKSKGKWIMEGEIKDPKYPESDWGKKEHVHSHPDGTKTTIHYWENKITGFREGFKFKDKDNAKSRYHNRSEML